MNFVCTSSKLLTQPLSPTKIPRRSNGEGYHTICQLNDYRHFLLQCDSDHASVHVRGDGLGTVQLPERRSQPLLVLVACLQCIVGCQQSAGIDVEEVVDVRELFHL